MKKRLITAFLLVFAIAFVLVGCSNSQNEEGKDANTAKPETKEATGSSVVRIAMSTEIDNLDPYKSAATDTGSMMDNVFDGLLDTNPKGELVGAIAKSYDISEDGLTYTFTLNEGVQFHDGSELTSEDVVASYETLAGMNGGEPIVAEFAVIDSIEAPSDYEVIFHLKEKNSAFLAANIVAIVPSDYEEQSAKPIGAGPFKFEAYKVGQELRLVKNENYYNQEKIPQMDEVQFKIMPDQESSVLAMQAGEIDVLPGVTQQGITQLGDSINTVSGPQNMVQLLALNNDVEPYSDLKVRQAINLAIDKDTIIDTVSEGNGTKLGSNFSPAMEFYYEPGLEDYYATNIEKAKSLLAEAGYNDGFQMELTVPSDYQFHVDTAQVIAEQLSQVGIDVEIKMIEFSTWLEDVYQNEQYDTTIIGFTGKLDPYKILRRYVNDYERNFVNYDNKAYDELIDQALRATDENEIAAHYKEAQRLLTEDAVSVFISDPDRTIAMSNHLEGLNMYPIQKFNLEDLHYTE